MEAEGVLSQFQGSLDRPPALPVNVCHTVEVDVRGLAPRVAAVPTAIVNTREHLPHSRTAEILHEGSIEVICALVTFVPFPKVEATSTYWHVIKLGLNMLGAIPK